MEYPNNLNTLLEASQNEKTSMYRKWDLSVKFLRGDQYQVWDRANRKFTRQPNPRGVNMLVDNQILPIYRTLASKFSTVFPATVVMPASGSYEDIAKASASGVALKYFWANTKMDTVLQNFTEYLLSYGTAALFQYYDADKDKIVPKAISPYDLFFEKGAKTVDESDFIAIRSLVKRADLVSTYPDMAEAIGDMGVATRPNSADKLPADRIDVYEVYWGNGKYAIYAGDKYLFKGDMPEGVSPVQVVRYTRIPDDIWGLGLIENLIELQVQYNKSRNQILDNKDLMTDPVWLVPITSGVKADAITNRKGAKIFYNAAGGKPTRESGVPLPNYVLDNLDRTAVSIRNVSGVNAISLGRRVPGVDSGRAMETLAAQDASQLRVTQGDIEAAIAEFAQVTLVLMREYYTENKMVSMLDSSGRIIFNELKSTNLVDNPEVFIQAGSLFRDGAAEREAKVLALANAGLIDKEVAKREIAFGTGNKFVLDKMQAISHANDILEGMRAGYAVEIYQGDDLATFKEVFGEFIKSREYYKLPVQTQDYIRDVFSAVATSGEPVTEFQRNNLGKVWPLQAGDDKDVATAVASSNSNIGQEQILAERNAVRGVGAAEDALTGVMNSNPNEVKL